MLDLRENDLDDPLLEVFFARDVVVERHRLDPELASKPAHAEPLDPVAVRDPDGGLEDALAVERDTGCGGSCGLGRHLA